jgi:hypothetical protein
LNPKKSALLAKIIEIFTECILKFINIMLKIQYCYGVQKTYNGGEPMTVFKDAVVKISESLKTLSEALDAISQGIDDYVKSEKAASAETKPATRKARSVKKKAAAPAKKKPAKAKKKVSKAKKPAKVTANVAVLNAIKASDNGANVEFLKEQTGFDAKKIANVLYRLKKQGEIKAIRRGVYTSL